MGYRCGVTATPAPAPEPRQLAKELGLTDDEYERIVDTLGREPSTAELGTYSVMWSEHCSYKSSKLYLRTLPTDGEAILVGPGENAGVVDVGGGLAVTFKIESHNHPSFVEPYQGAATGVGGIIRDILTMGARPIALMDPLRFGDPADDRTRHLVDGVVRGIGHYGNSIGVATVGGETVFDPCYAGNPLVNVLCVGVLPADRIQLARAESPGDVAVLIGQRTGRDGIGGASILASAEFTGEQAAEGDSAFTADEAKRPNVQVGDPFAGKLLIESCLQLYDEGLLSGIQDMGAAGIACSTSEMAAAAGLGMRVDLDRVPLREASMEAWEILCSESQERMLALVGPDRLDRVLEVCRRWGVQATPIGEVTDGDRLVFTRHGEVVHDAPAKSLVDEGPVYQRPVADWVHPHAGDDVDAQPGPPNLDAAVVAVLGSPNVASSRFVWEQYDSIVGSGTFQGPTADAGVLRLPQAGNRGVAVATDGNGRWCTLDPEEGAKLVVAEAARNVACTGARPVAATNCLNFGSPERPEVMGQFRDVIRGMAAACEALGTPITGGNVSFYNQTGDTAVHPTPVVGILGVAEDVTRTVPIAFRRAGDALYLVGAPTRPGLGGSEYLWRAAGRIAGRPPRIDLAEEAALHRLLVKLADDGLLRSAHDVSTGGLATSLVESCLAGSLGADMHPEDVPIHQWLFSESPTRVVVSVADAHAPRLETLCEHEGVFARRIGHVTSGQRLRVADVLDVDLHHAAAVNERALPEALGVAVR
ncbi:MAG: phosphoribosylformylglycinamidine synthase subunit PurL [Nitriliruptorales bacterium]|nr:phosphoribosylformylglycinamidine synthase subunit PurL [Nitriliruptorales bacterium]